MACYRGNKNPDVQCCIMELLISRIHFNSPIALRNSIRRGTILVSDFKGAVRFSVGSGYLCRPSCTVSILLFSNVREIDRSVRVSF